MTAAREKPIRTPLKRYRFSVLVEHDADGYFVCCPQLQGCYSQGESYEEALANIEDAIRLHVEDRLAMGESVPQADAVAFTSVEITVE